MANVCRPDARRSKQGLVRELVLSSLPLGRGQVLRFYVSLIGILPVESGVVVREVGVREGNIALMVVELVEVCHLLLVAVKGTQADLSVDLSILGSSNGLGKDHVEG